MNLIFAWVSTGITICIGIFTRAGMSALPNTTKRSRSSSCSSSCFCGTANAGVDMTKTKTTGKTVGIRAWFVLMVVFRASC